MPWAIALHKLEIFMRTAFSKVPFVGLAVIIGKRLKLRSPCQTWKRVRERENEKERESDFEPL